MQDEIDFMPLEGPAGMTDTTADLGRLADVPVELAVEIGRTRMTIGQTLELRPGSVVSLNRLAGEPVDLLVNGKLIARGEVVVIDEEFGLRVTDVVATRRADLEGAAADELLADDDPLASVSPDDITLGVVPGLDPAP